MERFRSVYNKTYNEYGRIKIHLRKQLRKRKITPYKLSNLTGVNYGIVLKYCNNNVHRVDLDLLARFCYALNCRLVDIIDYNDDNVKNFQEKNNNFSRIK